MALKDIELPLIVSVGTSEAIIAYVEETGDNSLFWCELFPNGQQDAHAIYFNRKEEVGKIGVGYYLDKELIAYITNAEESAMGKGKAMTDWAMWLELLKDPKEQEYFKRFIANESKIMPWKPTAKGKA